MTQTRGPALIADIGGTNVRFALTDPARGPTAWRQERVLACADFAGPGAAARAYLAEVLTPDDPPPDHGAWCVAAPVEGDAIRLTNHGAWAFSIAETGRALGLAPLTVVNDFAANARALPHLTPADWIDLGGGPGRAGAPCAVIGPGTGLGVALVVPEDGAPPRARVLATEGGHVTLAARTAREAAVIAVLEERYGHASAERAVSGPGLVALTEALCRLEGHPPVADEPPSRVMEHALAGICPIRAEALDLFFAFLGSVAGNLVLSTGAQGGVWLMGGILPRAAEALAASAFTERFQAKGRFAGYLEAVPRRLVTHPLPALLGLAGLAAESEGA